MNILSNKNLSAIASGKIILIGEHSVVYGHKAIAMAMPDISLTITLSENEKELDNIISWQDVWNIIVRGVTIQVKHNMRELLTIAFEKALLFCNISEGINNYKPQKITINSEIPLGGGMGGSAAISTCLLKLAMNIAQTHEKIIKPLTIEKQISFANEIDCLFHYGKASGLDVSAIANNGIIEFQAEKPPVVIKNGKEFWLALIDTQDRSKTATMIEKVSNQYSLFPIETKNILDKLGILAEKSCSSLASGNLYELADHLNFAHKHLIELMVSTNKINETVIFLRNQGALAAKLTGAGGGGLVLGLFENNPEYLKKYFTKEILFINKVPKT